jgi:hypothetical protein
MGGKPRPYRLLKLIVHLSDEAEHIYSFDSDKKHLIRDRSSSPGSSVRQRLDPLPTGDTENREPSEEMFSKLWLEGRPIDTAAFLQALQGDPHGLK